MITQKYNYLFYLTVVIHNWCSNNIIITPLISLFELFPISKERILKVKKLHIVPIDSYENGNNINFAFKLMMWTLTCFILAIELLIFKTYNYIELEYNVIVFLVSSVFLSIVINYLILWKSDKYKTYFRKFKKEQSPNRDFIAALIYHLTITIICFSIAINI